MAKVEAFNERLGDAQLLRFQIWFLKNSVMVWASEQSAAAAAATAASGPASPLAFGSLAAAFPPSEAYGTSVAHVASTKLIGTNACEVSEGVARHLAQRLRMPVYASIQLAADDLTTRHIVEQRLLSALVRYRSGPQQSISAD